jgi:hypothetical protein
MSKQPFEEDRLRERLDTLNGDRDRSRAAVRVEDLKGLFELPARLKSAKAAGAAPTKAEFDALVDDVAALHRRLKALHDALQKRLI